MIFAEFMYDIESYIVNKDYKVMFESNQSFKYSTKDRTLKRNAHLVKFLLKRIFSKSQNDTILDANNLTIEHLISDDGSLNNSSIWNLTLTTAEINSEELKNKNIEDKIKILKDKSTIKENQTLDGYLVGDTFDFDRRKSDLLSIIFDEVFIFNPSVFNITKDDVRQYRAIESIANSKKDIELMEALKLHGKNLIVKMECDPNLSELYNRWCSYVDGTGTGKKV